MISDVYVEFRKKSPTLGINKISFTIIGIGGVTFNPSSHPVLSPEFKDIVAQINEQGSQALSELYVRYRKEFVQWMTYRQGCDVETAKDIYQQSILALYENVLNNKLTVLTSSVKTYLFSVGRNKYYEVVREREKRRTLTISEETESDDLTPLLERVQECLEKLGEPCRTLLIQHYYHKRTAEQLAGLFDYKNADTAKNQKYKCLERLRKMVKETVQLSTNEE